MSDSVVFTRRDFLKLVGIGAAGTAAGCSRPAENLIPYLVAPEDILPGVAYHYASTCQECPVGCGIHVKSREGRAIKVEGNPAHPIGMGGLCARGQAGLQGLYDPDRIKSPMVKENGAWKAVSWDEAIALIGPKLQAAGARVAMLTGHQTGSLARLAGECVAATRGTLVRWEPFGYESVRTANRLTFGRAEVPHLDFAKARGVISFGTDFLETFASPVAQARGFAAMRGRKDDGAGWFVTVEPRLGTTGANADEWVAAKPGSEMALALGLAHVIVAEGLARAGQGLAGVLSPWSPDAVAAQTEVPADTIRRLARLFATTTPTLAVAGGVAAQSVRGTALVAAVNLLNVVAGNVGQTVRFDRVMNLEGLGSFADLQKLTGAMAAGAFDVLLVHGANPVYAAPIGLKPADAMAKVPFKVALATSLDETSALCDVVLPVSHALESLGDAQPARGVWSVQQAAMQRLPHFDSRPAGDVLIAVAKAAALPVALPDAWSDYVQMQWRPLHGRFGAGRDWDTFWMQTLKDGGVWEDVAAPAATYAPAVPFAAPEWAGTGDLALVLTPSATFFDGRGANKAWLQELPDPVSKAVWGSWAEIHPETAKRLGIASGDALKVQTEAGAVELPAYVYAGVRRDVVSIALGQGHTEYGRYAKGRGVNALAVLPLAVDEASGAVAYLAARATVSRAGSAGSLVLQQIEKHQHGRQIAQVIPIAALLGGAASEHGAGSAHGEAAHAKAGAKEYPGHYPAGEGVHVTPDPSITRPGRFTEPLARPDDYQPPAHAISAFEPKHASRSGRNNPVNEGSYKNAKHRWAMAIDLNACTGCSACVVACYAENNVAVVGPDLVKRGRDMAWIRIDRFEERLEPGRTDVRFVPMMCQHCSDAPCEIVCPVYATYHNPEGLNAQVYNRCVGTRYCSNNCPYKVRAFNWFDYTAPEKPTFTFPSPLNWQLNPDVTVRSKGVMEKCTMCVQRILDGKGTAKDEGRALRDGDILTACQQTCPAQAITFGDLADPDSQVHVKSFGERKYWVLEELNTKPGVTYLQRVTRDTGSEAHA